MYSAWGSTNTTFTIVRVHSSCYLPHLFPTLSLPQVGACMKHCIAFPCPSSYIAHGSTSLPDTTPHHTLQEGEMAALCRFFDTDGDGFVDGPELLRGFFKMQHVRAGAHGFCCFCSFCFEISVVWCFKLICWVSRTILRRNNASNTAVLLVI